jgi:hypothetical protein
MLARTIFSLNPELHTDSALIPDIQWNSALSLLSILALTLLFTTIFYFCSRKRVTEPSASLEALLAIITPTFVAWPTDYSVFFKRSTSSGSMTIRICVSTFLRNVLAGTVELKDLNDLPRLFRRQLRVYGWLVSFNVDFFLWTSVLRWIMVSQLPGRTSMCVFPFVSNDYLSIFTIQRNCSR